MGFGYGEKVWSLGQLLLSREDLVTVLDRRDTPLLKPEYDWERKGHCTVPAIVCNSIVKWQGKWTMYYGGADHVIGRAVEAADKMV